MFGPNLVLVFGNDVCCGEVVVQSLKIQFMGVLTKFPNNSKAFGHFEIWSDITKILVQFQLLMTKLQSMQ